MTAVFMLHLFSTLFMVGVIWFAQLVHYPLMERVGKEAFAGYEKENTRRTGWVVTPVMAVEWITGLLLLWGQPGGLHPWVPGSMRPCWG